MNPEVLLSTCRQVGIMLRLDGDKVKASGHEQAITQWLPVLKAHKEVLKAILSEDEQEFYEERIAIAEYDGGLTRIDAKAQAVKELEIWRNKKVIH